MSVVWRNRPRRVVSGPAVPVLILLEPRVLLSGTQAETLSGEIAHPLTGVPPLHSLPGAPAQLYLDFDGYPTSGWSDDMPPTPAYTQDGDLTTFTDGELASIRAIWARVAEKFSPFNIDVTTVDPGNTESAQSMRIVIGGDGAWTGLRAGGLSLIGSFYTDGFPRVGYVFSDVFGRGQPSPTAEAIAHEAGHTFGLLHQSTYDGTTEVQEYNTGNSLIAPVMGNSYGAARGIWWLGTSSSSTTIQDDLSILAGSRNGFGYRTDDHGNDLDHASFLALSGYSFSASGIIERMSDADCLLFTSPAGTIGVTANVAQYGPMLDLQLEIRDVNNQIIANVSTSSLGETVTVHVPKGSYCVVVRSQGNYGDIGQYTISGTIAPDQPYALVANAGGPYSVAEGESVALNAYASTGKSPSYAWDMDGDGIFGESGPAASRGDEVGPTPLFSGVGLDGPGSVAVGLRVSDDTGRTDMTNALINIADVPPVLHISGPNCIDDRTDYVLDLSSSDPGPDTIISWNIDWGDGSSDLVTAGSSLVAHSYTEGGIYTIRATATNEDGTYRANELPILVRATQLTLAGTSEDDSYYLRVDPADPDQVQLFSGFDARGALLHTLARSLQSPLIFDAGAGNDLLIIDLDYGDPIPRPGLTFHGNNPDGADMDGLIITGDGSSSVTWKAAEGCGIIDVGNASITFTDLAGMAISDLAGMTLIALGGQDGREEHNIAVDVVGDGQISITGTAGNVPLPQAQLLNTAHLTLSTAGPGQSAGYNTITVSTAADILASPLSLKINAGDGRNFLTIRGGIVNLATSLGTAESSFDVVVQDAAIVALAGDQQFSSLAIDDTSRVNLLYGGAVLLGTSGLSLADGATLDLAEGSLIVRSTLDNSGNVLSQINGWIGVAWSGTAAKLERTGIISSAAGDDPRHGLAALINDLGGGRGPIVSRFAGVEVGVNDILVAYTRTGDTDLNGLIDSDDYFRIDRGLLKGLAGYRDGDFNYDGAIDADDYQLIDMAFLSQATPQTQLITDLPATPAPALFSVSAISEMVAPSLPPPKPDNGSTHFHRDTTPPPTQLSPAISPARRPIWPLRDELLADSFIRRISSPTIRPHGTREILAGENRRGYRPTRPSVR